MLNEQKTRPFRGIGILQRWHSGILALVGREQEDVLRRETEELRQQMLALAATVTELRARQTGRQTVRLPIVSPALVSPVVEPDLPMDWPHRAARRLERISAWLYWLEPWWIEGFLTMSAIYAACLLLGSPDLFAAAPGAYGLVAALIPSQMVWGVAAAASATAMTVGLALTFPKAKMSGLMLRLVGITISGLFWFAMGMSFLIGDPTNVAAVAPVLASMWAFWVLVRFPAIP